MHMVPIFHRKAYYLGISRLEGFGLLDNLNIDVIVYFSVEKPAWNHYYILYMCSLKILAMQVLNTLVDFTFATREGNMFHERGFEMAEIFVNRPQGNLTTGPYGLSTI